MASARTSSLRGALDSNEDISLNANQKPFPMLVRKPKVSRGPLRGGLEGEFESPRILVNNTKGIMLSSRNIG